MTANPRALIATIVVLVVTPIFGLFVAPLLTLAPSGTAYAQEGPSIEIEFDPEGTVVATTSIDFTLTFSDLTGYDTNSGLKYRVNVVGSGNPSVTDCESGNAFSDTVGIGTISSGTATAAGTIPDTCLPGHHILVASLYDNNGDEIISTAKGFVVSSVKSLVLPPGNGNKPAKPAGLWGERVQHTLSPSGIAGTRFHVVDSASSTVYVYDLPAYDDPSTSTRDVVDTEVLLFVNTYAPASTTNPWGIVVEGPATWVSDDLSGSVDKVFAYTRSGERISNEEFGLYSANSAPRGMHYTGNLLVADDADDKIFAYERWQGSISYAPGRDYPLHDENTNITGIWASGHIMWVADSADEKLYAYEMYPTKDHLPEKDVNGITDNPAGIWSDNNLIYVLDSELKSIHGYKMPRRNNSPHVVSGPTYKGYPENSTDFIGPYRAQDPENRSVSWSLYPSGDHQHFNISGGYLYFNSPPNYEDAKDINGNNIYQLILIATSGRFAHTYFPVKVEVTDVLGEQPMFTDTSTTRTVEENTLAGENIGDPVEAVNPDDDPIHIYSMSGTDAASFDFSTSTGQIITRDALNFESKPSYSVRVSVRDGENEDQSLSTSTDDFIDVTIDITDLDEGPEVDGPIYVDHPEGVLKVAQYTADDPNNRQITWELSGDDDSKFRISATGTLTFGDLPDHETPGDLDTDNTYEITITATGGTETGSLDVTVYVANVNEAPYFDPSQATRSVVENTGYNQNVGAPVEASDDDDGDSLTYLLGGDDASSFSIDTSTGQILTDADLDHETDDSYTVTVTARDLAGATSSIAVLISVTNANDQPEFPATETGQRSVEENKSNTDVGAPVAASDQDGDGLTYELTGGDTSTFTTNSRTGQLTTVGALDSDTQATYSVTVSVRDGKDDQGGSDTAEDDSITVSITVTDVNETPVVTGVASPEFAENSNGTVAEYDDNDPESNNITWSLAGVDADDMDISGGTLYFNDPPDHEAQETYNVIVQAFDGNSTGTLAVVVTVTDVNEKPEFPDTTSTRTVEENTGANAPVGLPVEAEDPDVGDTLTYSLSGTGAASFTIDSNGQIRTVSNLDRDTKDIYNVTVEVHDGSVSTTTDDTISVTITVTDVNEPPVLTGSTSVELAENSTTTVGTYTATDPERVTPTWDLSGVDEDDFEITDGVLTFKSLPDHEGATDANTDSVYHVTIVASDGNNNAELPVTITVTNVNERPEFPSTETGQRSVVENTGANQTVGVPVAAIDPDRGDTLTYELGGQDASSFNFVTTTGQIQTKEALDSDSQASYSVTVSVRDSKDADGNADTATDDTISVTITVTDINEPPVVTGTTTTEYAENDTRAVETYTATDPENDHITWSLSGTDSDAMDITPSGGELTFNDPPNYEDKSVFLVTVQASDGHSTTTHAVRINITDINERPEFSGATTSRSVVENTPAGRNIGLPVVAADQDRGDALTYILDNSAVKFFDIDETTGQLKTKSELNAESRATYNVYVDVHDGKDDEGSPDTTVDAYIYVTITIENVDEPPVVTGTTSTEFVENSALTVAVYDARDPEGETVIWSLSGDDADSFEITRGALSFLKSPDYEAKSQYSITVDASDGGLTSSLNVNVTITNEDEAGAIDLSSQQPQADTPLTATLEDPDGNLAGDTWVWENSTSNSWSAISGATSRSYTPVDGDVDSFLRVTASYTDGHGSGKSAQAKATHSVRAAPIQNTAPEFQGTTTSREVAENSGPGVNIGAPVTATDAQQNDTLNYTLSGTDESFFSIDSQTGQLKTSASLNHEGKETYTVTVTASDPSNAKDTITVTITVTDVDEVPELTGRTTVEHVETATGPVHTFTAKDPEEGTITWGLSGDDEEDFTIAGGNLNFASTPDLENPADADRNNVYRVTVEASDGTNTSTLAVTVIVIGVNEPAVFPGATTSRDVTENTPADQNVGAPVSASDPEKDDLTYTLDGIHRQHFDIATTTGQILTKGALNYEGTKSYSVTVSVTDGRNADGDTDTGTDASIQVTINVLDENEAPEITGLSSRNWDENATGTVATYSADDPENATATWTVDGIDKAHFAITEEGVLSIDTVLDYENPADSDRNNVYQIAVQAADDGNISSSYDVTINITNVDEDGVVQLSPSQPEVGTLVNAELSDPDGVTSVPTWVWRRSSTATGLGTAVIANATASSYMPTTADEDNYLRATVSYTDQQGSDKSASGVTANAVQAGPQTNNAPAFLPNTVRNVAENTVPEQPIGDPVAAQDAQSDDNLVYELGGTDADSFGFSTSTGQLYTKAALDYETKPSYTVTITVSDGKNVDNGVDTSTDDTITVTINVTDVNEPPVVTGTTTTEYVENGTVSVATYTAVDPESDNISWSPLGGDSGAFTMSAGGVLSLVTPPDFETKEGYQLTVNAFDGELTGTLGVTVTITDVNEPPHVTGRTTITFVETATGPVETFDANDPEEGDIIWEVLGTDAGDFTIMDGALNFATTPNYQVGLNNTYAIIIQATDDANQSDSLHVTVIVTDVNQVPEFPGATTTRDVSENLAPNQNVGSPVSADDPENDRLTYSLSGTDSQHFEIATSSGQILTKSDLDYEGSRKSYTVTVSVTDSKNADGNDDPRVDDTIVVTINVIDDDEAPVITGATTTSWNENATGTVATYTATDPENATTTWTVHGPDAAHYGIASRGHRNVNGDLYIDTMPDYEDKPFYQVRVQASDGSNIADLYVTVTITNVDEPGVVALSLASPVVGTQINASLTDPDLVESATSWSWHRSSNKSSWDLITGASASGYTPVNADEDKYLRATASYDDGHGAGKGASSASDDKVPTTNSQPSFSPNTIRSVDENTPAGQKIGDPVTATDDESDDLTYSMGGDDATHFDIATSTGQLMTKDPLNFENKPSYSVTISVSDGKDVHNNAADTTDATIPVTVNVNNVNEPPELTGNETADINENETGTVATYTATDPEEGSISWNLSGDDENAFEIVDGVLTFKSPPNFEAKSTYEVTVEATDGTNTETLAVTVNVNNVEEPGTVTLSSLYPTVGAQMTAELTDPDLSLSDITWTWETSDRDTWTPVQTGTAGNAVSDSYTATSSDEGKSLRVRASYTNSS